MKKSSMLIAVLAGAAITAQAQYSHLDATVTNSISSEGNTFTWADQTANGNDAIKGPFLPPEYPSEYLSASGLFGVDMGVERLGLQYFDSAAQDAWLDFKTGAAAKSGFSIFVAYRVNSLNGNEQPVIANHGNVANAAVVLKHKGGIIQAVLNDSGTTRTDIVKSDQLGVEPGDTIVLALNYDAATGAVEFWDSKNASSSVTNVPAAGDFSSSQPMYLATSQNGGQFMDGMIGEVIVYDEVLDATAFSNQYAALTTKWVESAGVQVPAGVTALGLDSAVSLNWLDDGSMGDLGYYNIYRSTISGTNNYVLLTNAMESAFVDTTAVNDTTYYYAITAVDTNTPAESGFSAEVSATPAYIPPTPILFQHLDATVGASVTINGAGEVTAWLDQSGNANDAAPDAVNQASEPRYPSSSVSASGLVGVDMRTNRASITLFSAAEADSIFNFTGGASANSGLGILVAFKADSILTNASVRNLVIGNAANIQDLQIRYDQGALKAHLDGQTFDPGYMVQAGDTVVVGLKYTASTGETVFWNSGNDVYVTNNLSIAGNLGSSDLRLGGSQNSGQFFDGMIGEVKIFTSTLSAADFDLQLESLVNTWIGAPSFASWATQWGVDIGSETDDYDNNGLSNIEEYGLNGNPTNGTLDPAILPVFTQTASGFDYIHIQRNDDPALTYTVETSTDLVNVPFTNTGYSVSGTNVSGGVFDSVTNTIPTTEGQLFIRLNIEN